MGSLLGQCSARPARQLKRLALTDITYKLLAFVLLTPVVSVLFHVLVARSGRSVLADEDILQFALEPLGWVCLILVGTLSIAMMALEQVALMGILCAADHDRRLSVRGALRFAGAKSLARVAGGCAHRRPHAVGAGAVPGGGRSACTGPC